MSLNLHAARTLGLAVLTTLLGTMVLVSGCSSSTAPPPASVDAGPPACDPSKCLAGNQCLDDGTGTACHLVCATQDDCPFNYHCTPSLTPGDSGQILNYCAADKTAYTQGAGTWGATCKPPGGIQKNPACDQKQGFDCYAQSPTDGNAFCTQFFCADDTDCKGGWWCATENLQPNAVTTVRSSGKTYKVCKPRDYCAPCASDVDCSQEHGPEHCILDKNGAFYCSPECHTDSNCNNEARCLKLDQSAPCSGKNGPCVCAARAQECVGDGTLCAPCLSDADCPKGYCMYADYSSERFCSVVSGVPCTIDANGKLVSKCPTSDAAKVPVGCTTIPLGDNPQNQCVGLVTFTASGMSFYQPGCYTPNR